jgi:hypothetical protein
MERRGCMGIRKAYEAPELTPYGDIRSLTKMPKIKDFGVGDGAFLFDLSNPLRNVSGVSED